MIEVAEEVAQALREQRPVVAMDSYLLVRGLPRPRNRVLAERADALVREAGAVPATVGQIDGRLRVGIDGDTLARLADGGEGIRALAWRDLPPALAAGGDGALTPGAAAMVAGRAGVRVLATPGIVGVEADGGGAPDLESIAASGLAVVCGGALPPADAAATMQRCAALEITMVGLGSARFPGCYRVPSTETLDWVVDGPAGAARVADARAGLEGPAPAMLALTALPEAAAVPGRLHERLVRSGRSAAQRGEVSDQALPAFLAGFLHAASQQRTIGAHTALLEAVVGAAAALATTLGTGPAQPPDAASGDRGSRRLPKQSST